MATRHRTLDATKQTTKSLDSTVARRDPWRASDYPYETDYNDHFETPLQAYADVQALIDWLSMDDAIASVEAAAVPPESAVAVPPESAAPVVLYDPYYCNGRTKVLLHQLGYTHVVHTKRDFYADVSNAVVPHHDILITNPPYSDTHKQRCLDFCFGQLRRGAAERQAVPPLPPPPSHQRRSFLLLMPAYTATKQYYRDLLQSTVNNNNNAPSLNDASPAEDVVYLIPTTSYHYDHPDQSGKAQSPFDSLWFCGVGSHRVSALQQYWNSLPNGATKPILVTSLAELATRQVISLSNRPNPRQRVQKRKLLQHAAAAAAATTAGDGTGVSDDTAVDPTHTRNTPTLTNTHVSHKRTAVQNESTSQKKSKYRDSSSGKRTKKRF